MDVGVGLSTQSDPVQATRDAAQRAKMNLRADEADLAFVFTSAEFPHPGTIRTIAGVLGSVSTFGASSTAVISDRGVLKYGILILLIKFPKGVYCNTACVKEIKPATALAAGEQLGEKLLFGFKEVRRDFAVILSDKLTQEGHGLIAGVQEKLGKSFPLIGASVSKNPYSPKAHLYFNSEIISDSVLGIMWGGKLNFGLSVKHGWKPLGKPRRVTRADGNTIHEIENLPAARLYEEYLACDMAGLKKELNRISTLYPIGIALEGEKECLLRDIVAIQDDGSLLLQGNVPAGSQIRLMIGTKESCLIAAQQAVEELKRSMFGRPPRIVFIFESTARLRFLGRDANREIELVKQAFGKETAIAGISSDGNQAPPGTMSSHGVASFHNHDISFLAIGN